MCFTSVGDALRMLDAMKSVRSEAICIHTDGTVYFQNGDWSYKSICDFIGTSLDENERIIAEATQLNGYGYMFMDFYGYDNSQPFNAVATRILAEFKGVIDDPVVGNVVLFGNPVDGNLGSVSEGLKNKITEMGFKIEQY
jgi:hypothetical protein